MHINVETQMSYAVS